MSKSVARAGWWAKVLVPAVVGLVVGTLAPPEGLDRPAMVFLGVFAAAVGWLIGGVIDDHWVSLGALLALVLFGAGDFPTIFGSFAGTSVWLLVGAFGIAAVITKVGLLRRLALRILAWFPDTYRGQVSAMFAAGTAVTPLVPSLIGKGAVFGALSAEVAGALGFRKSSKSATGIFTAGWVTSGMAGMAFLTGAVPVVSILGFLPDQKAEFTWVRWFALCVVWLVVFLGLSFVAVLRLYRPGPDDQETAIQPGFAKTALAALGPMTRDEKAATGWLIIAMGGWVAGSFIGVDATVWALVVLVGMAASGLMSINDFKTRIAWHTIVFFGGVFSMAALVSKLGIDKWLAQLLPPVLGPVVANPYLFVIVLCLTTYVLRLVIVSITVMAAIWFAALSGVAAAAGIDPWVVLFVGYTAGLTWHFRFNNTTFIPALAATGGTVCEHRDTQPMNWAYMGINLIACLASIPLWQAMGMIR